MTTPITRRTFLAAGAMAAGLGRPVPAQTPLFDGSLDGWVVENQTKGRFTVREGLLRVEGPDGWLRSAQQYGDFVLHVEWRFVTADADSGIFLRAPGPASNVFIRGWPANAYQVQVRDISRNKTTNPLWIANLYRHRVPDGETRYDADAAAAAARGPGEWQAMDIDVRGDRLSVTLNGTPVTTATGIVNPRGHIGIQAETGVLEYRSLTIVEK
jgi:3-keto-disaccharide hydrolase